MRKFEGKTSKGVMLIKQFDNSIIMRSCCSCMSPEHQITIDIEVDKDLKDVTLTFYTEVSVRDDYWIEGISGWFKDKWIRIKRAIKILFTGYLELDSDYIFGGVDHINDFIKALEEAKKYCQDYIEENKEKE